MVVIILIIIEYIFIIMNDAVVHNKHYSFSIYMIDTHTYSANFARFYISGRERERERESEKR